VASTDRAFRALARASPRVIVALVRRLAPALVDVADDEIVALDDPHVDVPAHPREADFVARVGDPAILHVECQGYRDPEFSERVFTYHLALTLRHPERRVRTCALWLRTPAPEQRAPIVRRGDVAIALTPIVLGELVAEWLLSSDETACFAHAGAHPRERAMAAVAAASRGRYAEFVRAMEKADMEPVIIEDLVDYGYEQGLEEGMERGLERGLAEGLERGRAEECVRARLAVLEARRLAANDAQLARVRECRDVARLEAWLRRAAVATRFEDMFVEE
jgi:hypothetical protein